MHSAHKAKKNRLFPLHGRQVDSFLALQRGSLAPSLSSDLTAFWGSSLMKPYQSAHHGMKPYQSAHHGMKPYQSAQVTGLDENFDNVSPDVGSWDESRLTNRDARISHVEKLC
jgi:hypothetical protein